MIENFDAADRPPHTSSCSASRQRWEQENEDVSWLLFLARSRRRTVMSRDDENLKVFIFTNHEHENEDMS